MNSKAAPQNPSRRHKKIALSCPTCHAKAIFIQGHSSQSPHYCVYCGNPLLPATLHLMENEKPASPPSQSAQSSSPPPTAISSEQMTSIHGQAPQTSEIQFALGSYQILESIAKGGMGEVFLAYDTTCGRKIALKRIRSDLINHPKMHHRFLREARISSQLTHPAVIPVYTIHDENNLLYYTMPFVEGKNLKQIFNEARQMESKGIKSDQAIGSIPSLTRLFVTICQAVAYAHSKGVLHRDLKPENIIIGKYGEVFILDWGLAKLIHQKDVQEESSLAEDKDEQDEPADALQNQLTGIGKAVGTVSYMAPELALGRPATIQTDVFALGVILYQILSLALPFRRKNIKEFRQHVSQEVVVDPAQVAPYRDVPPILSRIAQKSLTAALNQRYLSVDSLLHDLENYLEGRSEWFQAAELSIEDKSTWEFQELVLIAEHMAIVRHTEASEWVTLMISKASFTENTKLEAMVRLGEKGRGIGFLLSVPEAAERQHLNDGYCLWLGSDRHKATHLLRNTVEVLAAPEVHLTHNEWYLVRIEKIDASIHFYLNNALQFSYISHLPLAGTHVGVIAKDADFELQSFFVYTGSHNITLNCLAVPDAFLAHKDYTKALNEYRRIGYSFPGRAEGREAMFRAGITLLEQGKGCQDASLASHYYDLALLEFNKLRKTPGAPLEYLGKGLVYQATNDYEEESKCFELATRRYRQHLLFPVLQEQMIYRMHESSRRHRVAAYHFILLIVSHFPEAAENKGSKRLFSNLQKHWENLPFILPLLAHNTASEIKRRHFAIQLAFWLAKPYAILEQIEEISYALPAEAENSTEKVNKAPTDSSPGDPTPFEAIGNALFCLIELGAWQLANRHLKALAEQEKFSLSPHWQNTAKLLHIAIDCHAESLSNCLEKVFEVIDQRTLKPEWHKAELRVLSYLMEQALKAGNTELIFHISKRLDNADIPFEDGVRINGAIIWAYLLEKDWEGAGKLLHSYPMELLNKETSILHFLYGCCLLATEGKEIAYIHFFGTLDVSYPRTWALCSHFLKGKIADDQPWLHKAFLWEKRQLYRQLALFYHCAGDLQQVEHYQSMEKQEYLNVTE